jgi:hypothetical protein
MSAVWQGNRTLVMRVTTSSSHTDFRLGDLHEVASSHGQSGIDSVDNLDLQKLV